MPDAHRPLPPEEGADLGWEVNWTPASAAALPTSREALLERLRSAREPWDVAVVGGGATGLGTALEAAARGFRTVLLEQGDFGQATSSRSTKLVHGGVRYLQRGEVGMVFQALRERSRLLRNAPHLVHGRRFVVPCYRWWEKPYYGVGLKLYDLLSGPHNLARSRWLSPGAARGLVPGLEPDGLRGGVLYFDGQFDDARMATTLALTLLEVDALPLNYLEVVDFLREGGGEEGAGRVRGVVARDVESGDRLRVRARSVINATGIFADRLRRLDDPDSGEILRPSRGTHLVLRREAFPGEAALLVPRTADGRVIFAIPWHGRVLVGTTDVPVDGPELEPRPDAAEVEYLLDQLAPYLERPVGREDIRSVFAGLRPLVARPGEGDTADLSRDHRVLASESGLVTVVGGKWTTYREMGEDALDRAAEVTDLPVRATPTRGLPLHGWTEADVGGYPWRPLGADAPEVRQLARESRELGDLLHRDLPYVGAHVAWAARNEMARTLEDALARRTSALLLDARAAAEAAPRAAGIMARELDRGGEWAAEQVERFRELASGYLPPG